jgi:hypothetical protein
VLILEGAGLPCGGNDISFVDERKRIPKRILEDEHEDEDDVAAAPPRYGIWVEAWVTGYDSGFVG